MILKILSRKTKSFRQLLRYITHSEERVPDSHIILHNITGNSLDQWTSEFLKNEKNRKSLRKNSTILTHEILSWHPLDTPVLTVEKIEKTIREYIAARNPNGLYVGAIHLQKDHYHAHLCVSGVEYASGKNMRMSKKNLSILKKELEKFQTRNFPELTFSQISHGKGKELVDIEIG